MLARYAVNRVSPRQGHTAGSRLANSRKKSGTCILQLRNRWFNRMLCAFFEDDQTEVSYHVGSITALATGSRKEEKQVRLPGELV